MMIDERLRAIAETLPDDARVSFTRSDLLDMLAEEPQLGRSSEVAVDLTVPDVAKLLGRAPATVRGWCASGELAGAYRLRGREWRIPAAAVGGLQRQQAEKHAGRHRAASAPAQRNGDLGAWRYIKSNDRQIARSHRRRIRSYGEPAA